MFVLYLWHDFCNIVFKVKLCVIVGKLPHPLSPQIRNSSSCLRFCSEKFMVASCGHVDSLFQWKCNPPYIWAEIAFIGTVEVLWGGREWFWVQGTDIVRSVMGCGPLSTGSFVFIQFSVQTADRGFILETVRMKGIGVLRYRISGIELRYRFHPIFIYCSCRRRRWSSG